MVTYHVDGYLKGFKDGLGPRFLVEMETWMNQTFKDDVWICGKCGKIEMLETECTKRA